MVLTNNHILIEKEEDKKISEGGIVLPDTVDKDKPVKGIVSKISIDVAAKGVIKPGQTVYFKAYTPDEVEIEGKKYLLCEEEDILIILD